MSERPTPETDAKSFIARDTEGRKLYVVLAATSKKIERERDEAREKIQRQAERIRKLEGATNHAGGLKKQEDAK